MLMPQLISESADNISIWNFVVYNIFINKKKKKVYWLWPERRNICEHIKNIRIFMISISSQVDFAMPTSSTTQTQFYRYLN